MDVKGNKDCTSQKYAWE